MGSILSTLEDVITKPVTTITSKLGIPDNILSQVERPASLILGKDSKVGQALDHPLATATAPTAVPDVPAAPPIPSQTDPAVVASEDTAARAARSRRGRASNYLMGSSGSNTLLGNSGGFFQPALGG